MLAALHTLALLAPAADVAEVLPLHVDNGRCECVVATPRPNDKSSSSSARWTPAPAPVGVRSPADDARPGSGADARATSDKVSVEQVRRRNELLALSRKQPPPTDYAASADPPRTADLLRLHRRPGLPRPPTVTPTVKADLRAPSAALLSVYLDHDAPRPEVAAADRRRHRPHLRRGGVAEGRETSAGPPTWTATAASPSCSRGWLDRLQNGKTSLGGFVRGSDFYRDLRGPVRQPLRHDVPQHRPRRRGRTCARCWPTSTPTPSSSASTSWATTCPTLPRQDEESWLNEGLAHLAEDLHGYGWSNLDYRVSAFLSAPERYPLVVADYYGAGLWRDARHPRRVLPVPALVRRPPRPATVREADADQPGRRRQPGDDDGEPFADLFRRWSWHCS